MIDSADRVCKETFTSILKYTHVEGGGISRSVWNRSTCYGFRSKNITWPQVLDLGPILKLKGKYIDLNYTFRLRISKRFKLWV